MAKPILIANWKNHPDSLEAADKLLKEFAKRSLVYKKLAFYIAPPLAYFERVTSRASNFAELASQDISLLPKGSHTGEVGLDILKNFGVRLAILGHSEVRARGETSASVAEKVRAVLRAGMVPVVCVGEIERDEEGEHLEFLRKQLKQSLEGLKREKNLSKLIVAYEPVWAIGKKASDAESPEDLTQSVIFIRKILSDLFGRKMAERISIIYGGSVEPANAEALYHGTDIKGFLVGHASLKSEDFTKIAQAIK